MKQPKKTSGKPLPEQKKKPDKTAVQNLKKHDSKLAQTPAALRVPLALQAHHLAQLVRQARPVLLAHLARHLGHLGGQARRVAIAEGHVAVGEGAGVLFCRRVELRVPELVGGMRDVELHVDGIHIGANGIEVVSGDRTVGFSNVIEILASQTAGATGN